MIKVHMNRDWEKNKRLLFEEERLEKYLEESEYIKERFAFRRNNISVVKYSFKHIKQLDQDFYYYLFKTFKNRCAYCESSLEGRPAAIDNFWPRSKYPHLGYKLDNYLPTCNDCNFFKADKFPLFENKVDEFGNGIPLLINPLEDSPEEHLQFEDDGTVSAKSEKGLETINTLVLNREDLKGQRKFIINYLNAILSKGFTEEVIEDFPKKFIGTVRTFVFNRFTLQEILDIKRTNGFKIFELLELNFPMNDSEIEKIYMNYKKIDALMESNQESSSSNFEYIEKIIIKDLFGINLNYQFVFNEKIPCLMIVGENGVGKTTLLQSLCYSVRNIAPEQDQMRSIKSGKIELKLRSSNGEVNETEYNFVENLNLIERDFPIAAYGSIRLQDKIFKSDIKYRNIFNLVGSGSDSLYLEKASNWLTEENRKLVQDALVGILPKKKTNPLVALIFDDQTQKYKAVDGKGNLFEFEELSSGFKTITNLVMDIVRFLISIPNHKELLTPAVILIDEIDVHLHPTWKIGVVDLLRDVFPKVQFIMTTHDPLCLRGLETNEVIVLKMGENLEVLNEEIPFQGNLRIEDLLLSDFFGLPTTLDPQQIDELEDGTDSDLDIEDKYRYYGYSPTEQIALKIIDDALDKKEITPNMDVKDIDPNIKASVLRLWNIND